ncbi:pre-mRNA-splicing factor syf2-like [Panonychus citri]|uniref:pre-mRNA-splicing factor syf2-like n=1 Tax=Panonychus citri TaxID=50023 RepID=UPI002307AE40|nr:pre-mRNA-splicing factor syf2-like [Panonychus citri]
MTHSCLCLFKSKDFIFCFSFALSSELINLINCVYTMSLVAGPSSSSSCAGDKKRARLEKLKELGKKRAEAIRENHQEVVEEYKKSQLPKNWARKQEFVDYKINEEAEREEAKKKGLDYDRVKMLNIQADEAEKSEKRKQAKRNVDPGFSGFEAATARQYQRLVKNIKPDLEDYEDVKKTMGDKAFYPKLEDMFDPTFKDTKEGIDRMVEDLDKQLEKRGKFSRRRRYDDDADIDFINERNMRFNKKLERFYGQYTTEIKQNLERGTAV